MKFNKKIQAKRILDRKNYRYTHKKFARKVKKQQKVVLTTDEFRSHIDKKKLSSYPGRNFKHLKRKKQFKWVEQVYDIITKPDSIISYVMNDYDYSLFPIFKIVKAEVIKNICHFTKKKAFWRISEIRLELQNVITGDISTDYIWIDDVKKKCVIVHNNSNTKEEIIEEYIQVLKTQESYSDDPNVFSFIAIDAVIWQVIKQCNYDIESFMKNHRQFKNLHFYDNYFQDMLPKILPLE